MERHIPWDAPVPIVATITRSRRRDVSRRDMSFTRIYSISINRLVVFNCFVISVHIQS
ncbi:hypothetical protein HanPI659440_Chr11g0413601 [Helianthus annuus]|nr:hypothetical protein HanPI659440_Chr11g0413601 [Helianthus annuus]